MTGKGHKLTGLGAAFMAAAAARWCGAPELIAAAVGLLSTTMPDWIEIPFYRDGQRVGSLITHRTITHWPPAWIALLAWGMMESGLQGALAIGAAVGAMVHILGDCPNPMGIPWIWPTKRIRFGKKGLWRSGQHEILLIAGFTAFGYGLWTLAGGVLPL